MNVVIYARYSSHNQNEQSIEDQIRECREYATRNNYIIIAEYIDRAKSGTKDNREQFLKMIEDSKQKRFAGVLVYQLDRFARNKYDSAIYKKKLKDNGVRVISAKENISDDPTGIITESLLEGLAEYYSAELALKMKRGRRTNNENNYFSGGIVPFGYSTREVQSPFTDSHGKPIIKKEYIIDKVNGPYVSQIFLDVYNGMKFQDILIKLKSLGIKTNKGSYFNKSSLYRLLTNKRYITIATYDNEEHAGAFPRLVEDNIFYEVQKILENNKHNFNKVATEEYILVPKIHCGYCNDLMTGTGGTSRNGKVHYYYHCRNARTKNCNSKRIQKQFIEDIVVNATRELLTTENINRIADKVVSLVKEEQKNSKLGSLQKSINNINRKKINLISAIAECGDSNLRKPLYEELSNLEEQRINIENEILGEELYVKTLSKTNIKHFLNQLKEGNVNSLKYRKSLIATFVKAIYVYEDKLMILFNTQNASIEVSFEEVQEANVFLRENVGATINC